MPAPDPATAPAPAGGVPHEPTETVIEPASGWHVLNVRELWSYRELLFFLAWRDVKVRYKQTALGAAWAVFQPLLMMAVFWLFLGRLAKVPAGDLPYALHVFSGLIPWFLFSGTVGPASVSLVDSERLISKVYFPRLTVPFAAAGPPLVDFLVAATMLGLMMLSYSSAPGWSMLLLPLPIALIVITAVGVGTFLSAVNVRYRDLRYVIPFMIQAWLFATPSIYLATGGTQDLPEVVRWVMMMNPMTGLIDFFRAALFGHDLPWAALGTSAALSLTLFLLACLYFRRVEDSFADVI